MADAPIFRLRVVEGKPQLEVALSSVELRELGELHGSNVDVLKQIVDEVPGFKLPRARALMAVRQPVIDARHLGKSLSDLFILAEGRGDMGQKNAGSTITVVVKDANRQDEVVYQASPQKQDPVEMLRTMGGEIKSLIQHDLDDKILLPAQAEGEIQKIDRAFHRYQRVFKLRQAGWAPKEIASGLNMSQLNVDRWLAGDIPSEIEDRNPARRLRPAKPAVFLEDVRQVSLDFAYLLGAYSAARTPGSHSVGLSFKGRDSEVFSRLSSSVDVVLGRGRKPSEKKKGDVSVYRLDVNSKPLVGHMNEVTQCNTRLPWEHLVTREEQKAFMEGYADFGGMVTKFTDKKSGVSYAQFEVDKDNGGGLIKDMAVLLKNFDVYPSLVIPGDGKERADSIKCVLGVRDMGSMANFINTFELRSKQKRDRIRELGVPEYTKAVFTPDQYRGLIGYYEKHKGAGFNEIAEKFGVNPWVATRWIKLHGKKKKPVFMEKLDRLEEIERERPDPEVIGYLFRELGVDSLLARKIDEKTRNTVDRPRIQEVKSKCATLVEKGLEGGELRKALMDVFSIPEENAVVLEIRPPYAGLVDGWIEGHDFTKENSPRITKAFIGLTASRYRKEGITRDEIVDYLLERVRKVKPDNYDRLAKLLTTEREPKGDMDDMEDD